MNTLCLTLLWLFSFPEQINSTDLKEYSQDCVSAHREHQRFELTAQFMPLRGILMVLMIVSSPSISGCNYLVGGFAGFIAGFFFLCLLKVFFL